MDESKESGAGLEEEEFELDLGEEETGAGERVEEGGLLDFEESSGETIEIATADLDLDLDEEKLAATAEAGGEELDLDLDFGTGETSEPEPPGEEAELEFDLDLEEAPVQDEPELELELEQEAKSAPTDDFDFDLDFGEEESATAGEETPTEESLDLTGMDEFLETEETPVSEVSDEEELDLGLETAADVTKTEEGEDEFDLDLETMLDDEAGVEVETDKEVSLETVGEAAREEARKAEFAAGPTDEALELEKEPEEITEEPVAYDKTDQFQIAPEAEELQAAAVEEEAAAAPAEWKRYVKPALIGLGIAAAVAVAAIIAYLVFGRTPPVEDTHGNLRIEISARPEYAFVENQKAGEILVVTGTVTNRYDAPRSYIAVKGNLYDKNGKIIKTSEAYCGHSFDKKALKTMDPKEIRDRLADRKGDKGSNVALKPGARIPYTVVFFDLPDGMDELAVEVTASKPAK